jgi:hypothetical protein
MSYKNTGLPHKQQTGIPFANLSDSRPVIQNFLMSIRLSAASVFYLHFLHFFAESIPPRGFRSLYYCATILS